MPITAHFCLDVIWRFQTFTTARQRITTSIKIFGTETPVTRWVPLMQEAGTLKSQFPRIGTQLNVAMKPAQIPQAMTKAPTTFVMIANPRPGNSDRYSNKIEILIMLMNTAYAICAAYVNCDSVQHIYQPINLYIHTCSSRVKSPSPAST